MALVTGLGYCRPTNAHPALRTVAAPVFPLPASHSTCADAPEATAAHIADICRGLRALGKTVCVCPMPASCRDSADRNAHLRKAVNALIRRAIVDSASGDAVVGGGGGVAGSATRGGASGAQPRRQRAKTERSVRQSGAAAFVLDEERAAQAAAQGDFGDVKRAAAAGKSSESQLWIMRGPEITATKFADRSLCVGCHACKPLVHCIAPSDTVCVRVYVVNRFCFDGYHWSSAVGRRAKVAAPCTNATLADP